VVAAATSCLVGLLMAAGQQASSAQHIQLHVTRPVHAAASEAVMLHSPTQHSLTQKPVADLLLSYLRLHPSPFARLAACHLRWCSGCCVSPTPHRWWWTCCSYAASWHAPRHASKQGARAAWQLHMRHWQRATCCQCCGGCWVTTMQVRHRKGREGSWKHGTAG
jgi:hypothetical protein